MVSADEPKAGGSGPASDEGSRAETGRPPISGFKKVLIGLSVVLMVAGGIGWVAASLIGTAEQQVETRSQTAPPVAGFGPSDGPGDGTTGGPAAAGDADGGSPSQALDDWSPVIFRLGFSFFVGFAIAYAVRTFLKISIVAIGIMLLALFGLQYADVINVDWNQMGEHFNTFTGWLGTQTASFKDFITGYLPSAASATAGLALGFKKR